MSISKKILSNFLILFSSQTIVRLLNFAIILYLVRIITPSEFGMLNFAKTITLYFGLIVHMGFDQYGLRELSKDRLDKRNLIGNILSIKFILAIFAYALLVLFIISSKFEYNIKKIAILYGLVIVAESISMVWVFNAFEKMRSILYYETISTGFLFILTVIFVKGSLDIFKIPAFEAFAVFLGCLILVSNFYLTGRRITFSIDFKTAKNLIVLAIPLGAASIISHTYYTLGVTILGFIKGMREVGLYMAPYKLVLVLTNAILGVLSLAIIPTIAKLYVESKDGLINFLSKLSKALLFLGFFVSILGTILAKPIIGIIYGVNYIESITVFRILIWWLAAVYASFHLTIALYACDKTKEFFNVSIFTLLVNIVLSIALIPHFNMVGLAVAMVLSGAASLFISLYYVNKNIVRLQIGKRELWFSIGAIGISLILLLLRFPLVYKVMSGTAFYLGLSFFMKILRREDLTHIKKIVFGRR